MAAAVVPILLRSPATGGSANRAESSTPLPLLALDREIAVPPDALRILGAFDGTVVLSAPSAYYLLPADGALAASRVPLAPNEVAAAPLGGGRLLVVRGGRVVARHPTKPEETDLGALPADAPGPSEGRVVASRSGRFLVIRGEEVLDLFERTEKGWTQRLRARVPLVPGEVIDLGERLLAIAQGAGRSVRAWSLPDGAAVLDAPFAERQVFAVAVDDARGEVAVGGPFDTVAVFSTTGSPGPRLLPRRGWTYGLAWVSDAPTLLASGQEGLTAWRNGAEPVALLSSASPGGALFLDSDFLLTLVPRRQRLAIVSYAGFPPSVRVPAGGLALWAAEHDAEGKTVFTGGRDGHLWSLDTRTLSVRREEVHTDGLTSLARDGDLLASSSDDKTVALWRLPGPTLRSRTKAHDFLVNDLAVVEGEKGRELVTSSSDGTVRRWSWPALDLLEKIDVQALLGRPVSFHAVWPAPGVRRILAGTWNSSLLELTFRGWEVAGPRVPRRVPLDLPFRRSAPPRARRRGRHPPCRPPRLRPRVRDASSARRGRARRDVGRAGAGEGRGPGRRSRRRVPLRLLGAPPRCGRPANPFLPRLVGKVDGRRIPDGDASSRPRDLGGNDERRAGPARQPPARRAAPVLERPGARAGAMSGDPADVRFVRKYDRRAGSPRFG
ncbi:MAG: hypothetical protein IPL90_15150 [Holophagales bacterium]|nr:hypothetical protein [Holophagales bacterium]